MDFSKTALYHDDLAARTDANFTGQEHLHKELTSNNQKEDNPSCRKVPTFRRNLLPPQSQQDVPASLLTYQSNTQIFRKSKSQLKIPDARTVTRIKQCTNMHSTARHTPGQNQRYNILSIETTDLSLGVVRS